MALTVSVSGCSSSGGTDTTVGAAPRPTKTALDLSRIPTADGMVTTAVRTTAVPTTAVPTTVALPPGVTEADRVAAEAAAIDWWEMFYDQLVALPNFDPNEIMRRSAPGTPGGPATIEAMEERNRNHFRFLPGDLHDSKVISISFPNENTAQVEVCTSDNGKFRQDQTGREEFGGLGASVYSTVLGRVGTKWLLLDYGGVGSIVDGKSCVDF